MKSTGPCTKPTPRRAKPVLKTCTLVRTWRAPFLLWGKIPPCEKQMFLWGIAKRHHCMGCSDAKKRPQFPLKKLTSPRNFQVRFSASGWLRPVLSYAIKNQKDILATQKGYLPALMESILTFQFSPTIVCEREKGNERKMQRGKCDLLCWLL